MSTGDSLADVETDKATMSFDSTEDGVIAKLLVNDGAVGIEIGQVGMYTLLYKSYYLSSDVFVILAHSKQFDCFHKEVIVFSPVLPNM